MTSLSLTVKGNFFVIVIVIVLVVPYFVNEIVCLPPFKVRRTKPSWYLERHLLPSSWSLYFLVAQGMATSATQPVGTETASVYCLSDCSARTSTWPRMVGTLASAQASEPI